MVGPVPVVVVVAAQLMAEASLTATLEGNVDAEFDYDQLIGFDTITIKYQNGKLYPTVKPASLVPKITRKLVFDAKGTVVAALKIWPRIDVIINGIPLYIEPYLGLSAPATLAVGFTSGTFTPNTFCLKGSLGPVALDAGVTVGIRAPQVAEWVTSTCAAVVGAACAATPAAKLAKCAAIATTNVDPCAQVKGVCDKVQSAMFTNGQAIPGFQCTIAVFGGKTIPNSNKCVLSVSNPQGWSPFKPLQFQTAKCRL